MISIALAVIVSFSEILPLLGITNVNGLLHGLHLGFTHMYEESECRVTVETKV
jgi:hypothetical protein